MPRSSPSGSSTSQSGRRRPDWWLFLTKFFQQGTVIGAVVPSSPWMARKLLADIDLGGDCCVVELGAGTGAISAELVRRAGDRCRAVLVERDADFCARLRDQFPRAEVVQADARDLDQLLAERGINRVDHVLCGLPLPWFAPVDRNRILDCARRHLSPTGSFRQLTYMPWVHAGEYRCYFKHVGFRFVWRNLPPGGFYVCNGPRADDDPALNAAPGADRPGRHPAPPPR